MSGQAPWENGRRAWQRLGGWHKPENQQQPITDDNREGATTIVMYALADLRLVRSLLDQEELGVVRRARQCGKSWTDIGVTLGMSPQAAWKRWHEDNEPEPVG